MSFFQRNSKLLRALPSGWHQPVRPTELQILALPTPTCYFVLSVPLLPASQGITTAFGHGSSLGGTCPGTDLVSHRHSLQFLCKIESQGSQSLAHQKIGLSSKKKNNVTFLWRI